MIDKIPQDLWDSFIEDRDTLLGRLVWDPEPLDESKITAAVKDCYGFIGENVPVVLWFDDPLEMLLGVVTLNWYSEQLRNQLGGRLRGQFNVQFTEQFGEQLMGQLEDQLDDEFITQLEDQLWDQFYTHLDDQFREQLREQLEGQLWGQLDDQFRVQSKGLYTQLGVQLGDQFGGQFRNELWSQFRGQFRDQLSEQLDEQFRGQLGDQFRNELWSQFRGQFRDQLSEQLDEQFRGQFRNQLRDQFDTDLDDQFRNQLREQLYTHLDDQFRHQLVGQLKGQLEGQLWDQLKRHFDGCIISGWWKAWTFLYQKLCQIPGIELPDRETLEKLDAISTVLDCHMWLPYKNYVFMCRNHTKISHLRHRLHNTNGPAVEWTQTKIWALEGVRVPEWVITNPDPKRILKDLTNAEQRRVAFNHYGWEKAIKHLDTTLIDQHPDPHTGTLYELHYEDYDLLLAVNASPHPDGEYKKYGMPVEKGLTTVTQAQAMLLGITAEEYNSIELHT